MSEPMLLDRLQLERAFSEMEVIRQQLPETTLAALAQEVVKRVANNRRGTTGFPFKPTTDQIDGLCHALLAPDPLAAIPLIEQAKGEGASYDELCQSYLAVAARRLGEWWEDDQLSFYKVTMAAGRIYTILRIMRLQRPTHPLDIRRSAVFVSVPGDNHTLGITIAADMARDKGWDIELFTGLAHDELVHALEGRDTALIGISASTRRALPALLKLIVALRFSNPRSRLMVCGQITSMGVTLDGINGADTTAADFDQAFAFMEQIATGCARRRVI
ncbi:MAG: cobalamin-dependent protein [Alphaproteobacteria bacterium]